MKRSKPVLTGADTVRVLPRGSVSAQLLRYMKLGSSHLLFASVIFQGSLPRADCLGVHQKHLARVKTQ